MFARGRIIGLRCVLLQFIGAMQEGSRAPNAKHPDNLATGGDFDSGTTYGGQYVPKVGPSLLPSLCNGGLGAGTTTKFLRGLACRLG